MKETHPWHVAANLPLFWSVILVHADKPSADGHGRMMGRVAIDADEPPGHKGSLASAKMIDWSAQRIRSIRPTRQRYRRGPGKLHQGPWLFPQESDGLNSCRSRSNTASNGDGVERPRTHDAQGQAWNPVQVLRRPGSCETLKAQRVDAERSVVPQPVLLPQRLTTLSEEGKRH